MMKIAVIGMLVLSVILISSDIVFASNAPRGMSPRERHYWTCLDGATPRETFYVDGRYISTNTRVKYVGSCSEKKHERHKFMIAAYNFANYME